MKVVDINNIIVQKLRQSGTSRQMRTLESADWLVIDESNDQITGAAGMGGLFHVSSIQIDQNFRGKGIGKMLQGELIKEAERRGFSFVTVFIEPQNQASVKLHNFFNYETVFRIHYSNEKIVDVKIIVFKPTGKIIKKFLSCFNSKTGIFFLACALKITKPLFKKVLSYNEENIPSPSIKTIVKNFQKI
jgi:GNAT superfamily N-acetyltransferase